MGGYWRYPIERPDLIQAGTEQRLLGSGKVVYDAWIEMLPQPQQTVELNVSGGDSITTSIEQQADGSWRTSIKDNTTGRTYQSDQQYQSAISSAEWIQESPSGRRGGLLPLADFGSVSFSAASASKDAHQVSIAGAGGNAITMTDRSGSPISQPSQLSVDGSSFSVTRLTPSSAPPERTG